MCIQSFWAENFHDDKAAKIAMMDFPMIEKTKKAKNRATK